MAHRTARLGEALAMQQLATTGVGGPRIRRSLPALLGLVAVAVLLGGCMQVRQDLDVDRDGTVSGTVRVGFNTELLAMFGDGEDPDALLDELDLDPGDTEGVTVTSYRDGDFVGQELVFDRIPVDEFADASGDSGFSIVVDDSGMVFRAENFNEGMGAEDEQAEMGDFFAEMFANLMPDVRIAITYPGRVLGHNGTSVSGSTVVWQYQTLEEYQTAPTTLEARWDNSGAVGSGAGSSWGVLLGILALVAVVAIVAVGLLLLRRRGGGSTPEIGGDGPPPGGAPAPTWPTPPSDTVPAPTWPPSDRPATPPPPAPR
jgi:hypothetical protein